MSKSKIAPLVEYNYLYTFGDSKRLILVRAYDEIQAVALIAGKLGSGFYPENLSIISVNELNCKVLSIEWS